MQIRVRKYATQIEEILHEGGEPPTTPLLKGAVLAVIENPYAGRYEPDIMPMMKALEPLGLAMAQRLVAALGGDASLIAGYGKGAIVGVDGEIEHGALWHVPGGYAMRDVLGGAKPIVPSAKKVAATGGRLDVPVTHINASYVRGHFDAMEVGVPDAPRPREMLLALVMTTGGRIHARVGGLEAGDIKGEDGLR